MWIANLKSEISEGWEWVTKSRYVRFLEGEIERLRAELDQARKQNWALVNSLVTTAGAPLPQEILRGAEASAAKAHSRDGCATGPKPVIRKRSWQQIARAIEAREMAEARNRTVGFDAAHLGPVGAGKEDSADRRFEI